MPGGLSRLALEVEFVCGNGDKESGGVLGMMGVLLLQSGIIGVFNHQINAQSERLFNGITVGYGVATQKKKPLRTTVPH